MIERYYSCGKLLITGEYLVLHGAKSLAIPTKYGQSLEFQSNDSGKLKWQSFDHKGTLWFETELKLPNLKVISVSNKTYLPFLLNLLKTICQLNSDFIRKISGRVQTYLEFDLSWGLGSSSTLIHNMANWAKINPFHLGKRTTSGSLYDLAVAQFKRPIIYQTFGRHRLSQTIEFNPSFLPFLYLIHLNKKQNTPREIQKFKKIKVSNNDIKKISEITEKLLACSELIIFDNLIRHHEKLLSKILATETIQSRLFDDYKGVIKSLGAWNGDFIMASGNLDSIEYFKRKGYSTVFKLSDFVQ
ncbi:MAG: GYDIA family GHMP kinase [Flavobacteriaceae bacterium]|nr:GYDIA family GHMP kinase [Flavobacteriaceae bacterium]MCY4215363.1 GYDIA family GHMP kinase [Flavobacteriaceae bacterium]MCY4253467.1 GYDIA family GHMP kinase [Flavobacteriaceae bacterium]